MRGIKKRSDFSSFALGQVKNEITKIKTFWGPREKWIDLESWSFWSIIEQEI